MVKNYIINDVGEVFLGISRKVPVVGGRYDLTKVEYSQGQFKMTRWSTSPVKEVLLLSEGIYWVKTMNNTYIVNVG